MEFPRVGGNAGGGAA